MARTNSISPANALQGKVAGLQISTIGTGGVTSTPSITIRGAKSLTKNNQPIFVIDGIVLQYEEMSAGSVESSGQWGNQLKNLNPDDYENITVLKGAAATALYGSRGANGAIVITTKTGKARQGIGVEVKYTHEWQDIYQNAVPLQNRYGMGSAGNGFEGNYNPLWESTASAYSQNSFGPRGDGSLIMKQYYKTNNPAEPLNIYKDNWKAFFQSGKYDNVTISLTGGSEQATYRLSYGYTDNKGYMINNSFDRHSLNFSTNGKINDVFSVDFNIQYTNSNARNASTVSPWNWNSSYSMITGYYANRSTDLHWYRDNYVDRETYRRIDSGIVGNITNRFNTFLDENVERNEQTIIAKLGLTAEFTDWLDASVSVSFNDFKSFTETKNYGSGYMRGSNNDEYRPGGKYGIAGEASGQYNGLAQVHANYLFLDDNLELDVRVASEIYGNTKGNRYSKETTGGLITPGLWSFSNSADPLTISQYNVTYNKRNNMTVGLAGIVNLSWKDQINLELTARNDWVSTLLYPSWLPYGGDNYSVFYPSANVAWVFSDTFDINPDILSFGQLRASFSQVGMGTGAYDTASGGGGFTVTTEVDPAGNSILTASPNNSTLPNYDLKPEIQQSIEFGTDLRFLNSAIGIDVTYYKTNTKNQILKLGTVAETGISNRMINAGNIQNQGWEIQIDATPIRSRSVRWTLGANWTRNRGKIKELHPDISELQLFGGVDGSARVYAFENGPYGIVTSGGGYGASDSASGNYGPRAKYNNASNPNDPNNGKYLLNYLGTYGALGDYRSYGNYYFGYYNANRIEGYFGEEASYWGGAEHKYENLGRVEPNFLYGFHTTVTYNIPNAGSIDLYAQIDGRSGGRIINPAFRYTTVVGSNEFSLYGRDAENGGVERVNYKGETVQNGMVLDGVFLDGVVVQSLKTGDNVALGGMTMAEAVREGHIQPMLSTAYYQNNFGWAAFPDLYLSKGSYMSLREITVGYNFPEKWLKHVGMQSARLSFTARNICYLYNGLIGKTNPESLTNNNPLTPYDVGGVPFARNFSFSLNLRF